MFKLLLGLVAFAFCAYIIGLVVAVIGTLFEVLFKYWWILALGMVVAVGVYLYAGKKKRKQSIERMPLNQTNRKKIPTKKLDTLVQSGASEEICTEKDLENFFKTHELIRSFHTRVVGVKYDNDDGSSRQEILSHCLRGEPVGFEWYTYEGAPACAVISDHGQIGHLSADLASDLHNEYQGDEYCFVAQISDITGGTDGYYYGCNLLVCIYGPI